MSSLRHDRWSIQAFPARYSLNAAAYTAVFAPFLVLFFLDILLAFPFLSLVLLAEFQHHRWYRIIFLRSSGRPFGGVFFFLKGLDFHY